LALVVASVVPQEAAMQHGGDTPAWSVLTRGCCEPNTEAHFETIRYNLDRLDNQVHRLDDKYKTAAEEMIDTLNDKEERAKSKLKNIESERHALEAKVMQWKDQRDFFEQELLDATKTRSCHMQGGCSVM